MYVKYNKLSDHSRRRWILRRERDYGCFTWGFLFSWRFSGFRINMSDKLSMWNLCFNVYFQYLLLSRKTPTTNTVRIVFPGFKSHLRHLLTGSDALQWFSVIVTGSVQCPYSLPPMLCFDICYPRSKWAFFKVRIYFIYTLYIWSGYIFFR